VARTSRSEGRPARRGGSGRRGRPGSPRARLFLALDLPERERGELAAWRDRAIAGRDDLRAVPPESLHVTLVFLGYQFEKDVPRIAEEAFAPLRELGVVPLRPAEVIPVGPRREPRLFALDLADEEGACMALQAAAAEALTAAGRYRPEKRPFWPHLTLCRVKRGRRAAPLEAPPPPGDVLEARDVVLYRSLLRPQGAVYEPLERLRLG
jgi:2'-5' RNA ligase